MTAGGSREPDGGSTGGAGAEFDTSVAHIARVYDYWLGGKDNFAADRAAGRQVIDLWPDTVHSVRANRAFLARAVRFLAGQAGIRQFLDIGTGIPTANNTHEVAQSVAPDSRVVYVDNDHCKSGCVHVSWGGLAGRGRRDRPVTGGGHGAVWWCSGAVVVVHDGCVLVAGATMTSTVFPASMCLSTSGSVKSWARRITVCFPVPSAL